MAYFNQFPYTNFHELNLDWILAKIKELEALVSDVPTEGGLDAVRAELEVLRRQLTAAVAGLERDIDGLTASDVGALPNTVTKLPSPASLTFTGAAAGSYDGSQAVTINIPAGGGGGGISAPLNFTGRQTATYDGSQPVDINLPEKLASPNAITFTGGVTGTYDGSAPMTVNIPTGGSGDVQNQPLTFTGAVTASYDGSEQVAVNIPVAPAALPNPNALTFTGAVTGTYDGSAPLSVVIPQGGEGGVRYRFIGTINVETANGQGAGSVVLPIGGPLLLQPRDMVIIEYDPYNSTTYSGRGLYTTTLFWDLNSPNSIYLGAVYLGEYGATNALGRSIEIKNAGDASGIEIVYGTGYKASIGQSGTAAANNTAIGIKRIHIIRQNL